MTAIVVAAQRSRGLVHLATDAALYDRAGRVAELGNKVCTIPNWPGAITNGGNAGATLLLGTKLSQRFATFDDFVARANVELPGIVADCGLPTSAEVVIVGMSAERGAEAFAFRTDDSLPAGVTPEEAAAAETLGEPCKLVRLPELVMMPVPSDQVMPANYEGIMLDADPAEVIWSLRKIVTMQRHCAASRDFGAIGGFATCTSVSAEGITQRMLARWPEDRVGAPLRPAPLDWKLWHVDNPKPGAAAPMSRLKQNMLDRKNRRSSTSLLRIVP